MSLEIKQKTFQVKARTLDQEGQVLIAVNAFNNEDTDRDISKPGSFKKTLKENFDRVRWFLNHDICILLGVPIEGWEDPQYLNMKAQFNLKKEVSRDTYEDYKLFEQYGKSLEHSVGLQAVKYTIDKTNPENWVRIITEWKLWEFSTLTGWAANPNTPLIGIKSFKGFSREQLEEILTKMNGNSYSDERRHIAEKAHNALFIVEPSRVSLKDRAAVSKINSLLTF